MKKNKYIITSSTSETGATHDYKSTTRLKDALKIFTQLKRNARNDVKDEFDTLKKYYNQKHPKVEGIDIVILKVIFDDDRDEVDYIQIKSASVEGIKK